MSWGPFNSEQGGKPIFDHLTKQVFPVITEIQQLSLEIGDYEQGFINSFYRGRLSALQKKYRVVNKKFFTGIPYLSDPK